MHTRTGHKIAIAVAATVLVSASVFGTSVLASPAADSRDDGHHVTLTFTKWGTITPGGSSMEGFVQGDGVDNPAKDINFAGQVLVFQQSDIFGKLRAATGDIQLLEALYEVKAGDHSFRALVHGGADLLTNEARLDGTVLGGWLTGERVHVEFQTIHCSQSNAANGTCFHGTITITPEPAD